jgi:hypothetical protein
VATNEEKERRIRERAYQIWLDEGKPQGRDKEHWRQAEAQIDAEDSEPDTTDQSDDTWQQGNGVQPPLAGPYENIS